MIGRVPKELVGLNEASSKDKAAIGVVFAKNQDQQILIVINVLWALKHLGFLDLLA